MAFQVVQQIHIIPQQDSIAVDPPFQGTILQFQDSPWAHGAADPAAYTAGANNILSFLCISPHIDAHFTIGGAISAGDTLSAIGGDPETRKETLLHPQHCCHGTPETAPYPVAQDRVEAHAYDPGKGSS